MKVTSSVFALLLATMSVSAFAQSSEEARDCKNEGAASLALAAKKQINAYYRNLGSMDGIVVTGTKVGDCDPYYAPKLLGFTVPGVAMPPVCGVKLKFVDEDAERNFAMSLIILAGETRVSLDGQTHHVPVCGESRR